MAAAVHVNQEIVAAMTAHRALEARIVVAPFLPDPHPGSLSNERSGWQVADLLA